MFLDTVKKMLRKQASISKTVIKRSIEFPRSMVTKNNCHWLTIHLDEIREKKLLEKDFLVERHFTYL